MGKRRKNQSNEEAEDEIQQMEVDATQMLQAQQREANSLHPKLAKLGVMGVRKSPQWKNRQRTLVFTSRGISFRLRHLMHDLQVLLPHSKKEDKMDRKEKLQDAIPELCEMRNCNNCVYLEMRKKQDAYMWVSKMPHGPSARFLMQNIHTMDELKLTGNTLRGSRPILHFDPAFDSAPHWKLIKELFFQAFGTPKHHPKSKPFVDRIMSFYVLDDRIWVRNYQITWNVPGKIGKDTETKLTEIGPRIVLQPIRIFEGAFGGPTLYQNTKYVTPNLMRAQGKKEESLKYRQKVAAKDAHQKHVDSIVVHKDEVASVFEDVNRAILTASKKKSQKKAGEHDDDMNGDER